MKSASRRGFTLIELLIVVAIVAIMAGGLLTVMTAPSSEQGVASTNMEMEAGAGRYFVQLVADAHGAQEALRGEQFPGFALPPGGEADSPTPVYFIDGRNALRRAVIPRRAAEAALASGRADASEAPGSSLVDGAVEASLTPVAETGLWQARLRLGRRQNGMDMNVEREVRVIVGKAWAGDGK